MGVNFDVFVRVCVCVTSTRHSFARARDINKSYHRPTNDFSKTHVFSLQAVVISSQSHEFRLKLGYGALQVLIFSLEL